MTVKDEDTLRALEEAERLVGEARRCILDSQIDVTPQDAAWPAVRVFAETLAELLGDRPLSERAARRAALIAASGQVWEDELGPLLTSTQVGDLLGDVSRQRVSELLRGQRLIGMSDSAGRLRYPAFQFAGGRPLVALVDAFWVLAGEDALDPWSAASWCVAPDDQLDGASPAKWAADGRDGDRLILLATRDHARLGH
jgi:hypothetical protein